MKMTKFLCLKLNFMKVRKCTKFNLHKIDEVYKFSEVEASLP